MLSLDLYPEPDWVASEREQFTKFRDTDQDGFLDIEEVKVGPFLLPSGFSPLASQAWIIPPDFDHSEAEAKVTCYLYLALIPPSTWSTSQTRTRTGSSPRRRSWRSMTSS